MIIQSLILININLITDVDNVPFVLAESSLSSLFSGTTTVSEVKPYQNPRQALLTADQLNSATGIHFMRLLITAEAINLLAAVLSAKNLS